ncbi:hypothetical protein L9F63_004750 [Diploptera punctata]|uniref:Erythroid differentiation-related factor 1 n=1 Tax=Diploptera punctata TaxID=6984 RepID=A0AAD8E6X4_DIPPU|nr:hypothetical protein L9F63_004750 [Diploptera punctata]
MEGEQTLRTEQMGENLNYASPDSPRKPVKSTAVVKYSAVQSIANFAQLQCNTDLNLPPSNWLSNSAESYGLQYVPFHSSGFSSFRMAHMFPDCVGEVDVVSDAENIKKLLKIPYSKGPVSMMVHRIQNTLLIDEFDIHKHLFRTDTDWEWLRKFVFDHVLKSLSDKDKGIFHKNNSRYALQQKSLVSKFLYHSIAVAEPKNSVNESQNNSDEAPVSMPVATSWPPLPEPRLEENLPDPASNHKFARNVVWTFEDIQMLIGTDMPIFGGATHPCISLRLRDMAKPISVLTGIDYWLDNLMCNVPELVMCYHLDGIVQKYELIKTEDLPHMENSKFSPKVIRDVAQNILSFLKSNATKAGHTYWLFKDDDIVKLYDLTSLCTEVTDDKEQNPFTVPVAMLLYRVARNMKHSPDGRRQQGTIRMLLKNCLALLAKEKYPQIVTSAHYMLADLYVPSDTDPAAPCLDSQVDDEVVEDDKQSVGEEAFKTGAVKTWNLHECYIPLSVAVKSLCISSREEGTHQESKFNSPPPVCGGVEERCKMAVEHVAAGLECLQYFDVSDHNDCRQDSAQNQMKEEKLEVPKMAHPYQAIPMPYSPLSQQQDTEQTSSSTGNKKPTSKKKKKKAKEEVVEEEEEEKEISNPKALLCKSRIETMPIWQQPGQADSISWNVHLKTLLYEKASLVYVTLAESDYVAENYGRALQYVVHVLHILSASGNYSGLRSYLLSRAGDFCFMIVQDWKRIEVHKENYTIISTVDQDIMLQVEKDVLVEMELLPETFDSMEQMLQTSCRCYERALTLNPKSDLQRRLGNIHNELGVLYMNQAAARYQEENKEEHVFQLLFTKSLHHLEAGVKAFEAVRDEANLALLHSNTGRLMRMCAHFHSPDTRSQNSELGGQERHFYNKALSSYQKAVQVLGDRRNNPTIWDTVIWELSTTLYTMATLLQDYPALSSKSQEEVEREVVEVFMKALKYCDLETPGPRQPIYQFRAASIHHRLGSLYHKSYRTLSSDETRRKNMLMLARLHYEKSVCLLQQLEHPSEFLRVQMERVALAEYQAQSICDWWSNVKAFQAALEHVIQARPILKLMLERAQAVRVSPNNEKEDSKDEEAEELSLVKLLEQRLQFLLRNLTKLCLNKKELGNTYKNFYSMTLQNGNKDSPQAILKHLLNLISAMDSALR